MVLQGNSTTTDAFGRDDAPPPDSQDARTARVMRISSAGNRKVVSEASTTIVGDDLQVQYRVNGGPLRNYQIPFDRMPLQGFTRRISFGSSTAAARTAPFLIDLMTSMESFNGKPLTQTEAEGLAFHVGRRQLYNFAGVWGGVVLGLGAAYASRKSFKFPFRKPKPVERYNKFPLQRAPLLTGRWARINWHMTRSLAYVAVSWLAVGPLAQYFGATSQAMHLMRDDRTAGLVEETSRAILRTYQESQEARQGKKRQIAMRLPGGQDSDQTVSDTPGSNLPGYGEDKYRGDFIQDDNSPTSSQDRYQTFLDAQTQSGNEFQKTTQPSQSSDRNQFDSEPNPPTDPSPSPFFNDDASPTAGNDPHSSSSSSSQYPSNAWARIRQSTYSTPSPLQREPTKHGITPPQFRRPSPSPSARQLQFQQQQLSEQDESQTSSNGDNSDNTDNEHGFHQEGQDRQRAREQSQREFDLMVDAERKGEEDAAKAAAAGAARFAGGDAGAGDGDGEGFWARRRGGS